MTLHITFKYKKEKKMYRRHGIYTVKCSLVVRTQTNTRRQEHTDVHTTNTHTHALT